MKLNSIIILGCFLLLFSACDKEIESGVMKSDLSKDVEMVTDYGTIIMRLSDKTPIHRNNFIKLVNQKFYDSIAFHRVIEDFVIQAGNSTTKPSQIYNGNDNPELRYTIDAEIKSTLFHKRGALAAARRGGVSNRSRASSGFQFFIVQKGVYVDSTLNSALERVNRQIGYNTVINDATISVDIDKYSSLLNKLALLKEEDYTEKDTLLRNALRSKIDAYKIDSLTTIEFENMKKYTYPEAHREIYKTIGGTPHLDQNYTVFGEVIKGMNIVDSIAAVKTNEGGKPIDDLRILSVRMIERRAY